MGERVIRVPSSDMENDKRVPLYEILIDRLVAEAIEKGYEGRNIDGYVSATIEQRGREALRTLTEQFTREQSPTDRLQGS